MSKADIEAKIKERYPTTGEDVANYVEGVKNATIEGGDLIDPFQQMSNDNYVLFKQFQADKKTSPGEFFGIAKDTFNQVRDELATGIGTAAYKTYQGEGVEVAKSLGEGMTAGMVGTYDILNKIFDPAQPIPRKEDFVGKVAKPNYASNAFMGMGGMIPNAVGQDRVNTEEDYNNLIASEKQRDSEIVNRLYAMESTMRNASIPEVARGGQFVDPFLAAGLGGALVKVALKGGKTLITRAAAKAAAQSAVRAAGTEGVETAAETAARTAAQGADNIPSPVVSETIESGGMTDFTPDPNAPMGAFASTAPSPMAQAGLRAAETTAGAVQFTAGLPSQGLKKLGEFVESVAPGMGTAAQGTVLGGSVVAGAPAVFLAQAKTTEKVAELLRSFLRVSQEEASRAGRFERVALDPLTSPVTRKAAATLAQFQPIARTIVDLSKGAIKGGVAGSVVGGVLGGLAERNLEGAAAGMGAGTALGGFYGTLHAGFDIGKEAFGGSTLRTRTNASGDINRFIASRPELEQAGWTDAMRILVEKIGPERAASQMDALRVAEASGVKLRIATPDENKLWKAPGWLDPDKGELVLNPPKLRADTPAHEATHAIFASNVKRQYRSQIEEAIYGIPDPVTGGIVKAGFLDDAALAKVAEQIRDSYKKGDQTIAADRFEGFANNLKNSTDKESLIKARSAIADEMAADYGGKFFARVKAGRFNPDRLPLVYRNALNAIDDGIYNTFKSVVYERGMDLGFDNTTKSFRNANGKQIRSPQLDEIFKRAYSQKSTAETVVSKKPDLIPANPADRAIWAKTHGGARGILNEDNTPKSMAQIDAEAAARWQNMTSRLSPLPEGDKVGLNFSRDQSGKTTMTAQGQLSPAALTAILDSDMLDASANAVLRDVIISMQDPNKSTFDTRYYKVHERGKGKGKMVAGVYPPSHNEILPFKVTMNSKEGVNIHAVDMTKVRQRLATAMNKPQFKDLYSNPTDALKDFKKYLDNITQPGRPAKTSAELLGGETGSAKRNLFYEALGFKLSGGKSLLNVPDSIINKYTNTIKTYRVERFTKLVDTGFKFPFEEATTYYRGMENFQPAAFTPETLPNGESFTNPDGFRILNKTGSKLFRTYDDTGKLIGVAESKEKAVKKAMDEATKRMTKEEVKADKAESSKRFQSVTPEQDAAYLQAVKFGDKGMMQKMVEATAKAKGYIVAAFHGTSRGDRVGNRFLKKRATSGPMAFFTTVKEIAEGYAKGKADTSLPMPESYADWFKIKLKGDRRERNLTQAWFGLTNEQKKLATEKLKTVGYADPENMEGAIIGNSRSITGDDQITYELRQARGNALEAAKSIWLDSGSLFNDEARFLEVLDGMGIKDFKLDDPNATQPKVYSVALAINNPFETLTVTPDQIEALQVVANRQRKKPASSGADVWDKTTRDPQEWMTQLREDTEKGINSMVWTSIPDWVTQTLKDMGYDGIHDTGGKMGGDMHDVYIPFEKNQIKSLDDVTLDSKGKVIPLSKRFNPETTNIRFQSLTETEANAKLKQVNMAGQYGAWISPKGELFKFRTMYGHAEEIEKLVPSVKIKSPDDYNKVYDKKWVRVVNDRSNIYLTTTKPLTAEQRSTIDFMGVENEKNIILNNTQSEKIVYTHIKFQPDPASPNILNGSDGSRIIKSTSGKYRVYLATGALAGVKETLESAQKLIERKSNK